MQWQARRLERGQIVISDTICRVHEMLTTGLARDALSRGQEIDGGSR
jgi:hypothetical protein